MSVNPIRPVPSFIGPLQRPEGCRRMYPIGSPVSPTGWLIVSPDGRRLIIRHKQQGTCTWCGVDVRPPRRTWCSGACTDQFWNRNPNHLRRRVRRRDRNKPCACCGAARFVGEIDHTTPIVEGGDPWSTDNMRKICEQCHKAETKALAGRRAADRRAA